MKLKTYQPAHELLLAIRKVTTAPRAEQQDLFIKAQALNREVQHIQLRLIEKIKTTREQAPQQYQEVWTKKLEDAEKQSKRLELFSSYLSLLGGGVSVSPQH